MSRRKRFTRNDHCGADALESILAEFGLVGIAAEYDAAVIRQLSISAPSRVTETDDTSRLPSGP